MNIIGIDPGITGAISLISSDRVAQVWDMPTVKIDNKLKLDLSELNVLMGMVFLITHLHRKEDTVVYIEKVHSMPNQGVSSTFKFGMTYGAICQAAIHYFHSYVDVTPQKWKKKMNLLNCEKDAARLLAIELLPELADKLSRKKDHGRADALLIGSYGLLNRGKP